MASSKLIFKRKLMASWFLEICLASLLIAALAVPYYYINTQNRAVNSVGAIAPLNATYIDFYVTGTQTLFVSQANSVQLRAYSNQDWDTDRIDERNLFSLIFAANLIGVLVAIILGIGSGFLYIDVIRNRLLFHLGFTLLKAILISLAALLIVACSVAFLALLGITNALDADTYNCQSPYCQRFQDNVKVIYSLQLQSDGSLVGLQVDQVWGPHAAWYIVLTCIPLSIANGILLFLSKFPIPSDEISCSVDPIEVL